ncbi:hypothetical protein QO010_001994 [Caulobacter ginsengisoli]|uniref:DUF2147 domain-containing protein n=1 Tax=Caulobacter ginsengisoli TaxID=400775 RepID=A0ABU0IQC2_9CAUL|nr:hypothetical protein [Caulobacter ginsengisoli]MDQ0464213.1 hypothetical protein [Caulobacter ginsengisoli]
MRLISILAALFILATPGLAQADNASGLSGEWVGSYVCNQGKTSLNLLLAGEEDGTVAGVFTFGKARDGDQKVPDGSYRFTGTVRNGLLRLQGETWITRPDRYEMVGLLGFVGFGDFEAIDGFSGQVLGEGCKTFTVKRTD